VVCVKGKRRAFFRESRFTFKNEVTDRDDNEKPDVKIDMPRHRFIIMELSANGFGSPEVLINERVDLIMEAYDYLCFKSKYESQTMIMRTNKWK
jgi:hypothetical protein